MKTIALFAIACLVACTSKNPKRPEELGGCLPISDAACGNPVSGGGGIAGGGAGAGLDSDAPATIDASTGTVAAGAGVCGTADSLISTANLACKRCIVMNCCPADEACTDACASLLQCAQSCATSASNCVGDCETTWSAGLTAYQDFAQCLSLNCSPQCPSLRQ